MNDASKIIICEWLLRVQPTKVADVGSYNINGAVKDIWPCLGFDVVPGPGVDVLIEPGVIPPQYRGKFDGVTCSHSFQFAPNSRLFLREVYELLAPGGHFILTMCPPRCTDQHSTSPGPAHPETRYTLAELQALCESLFVTESARDAGWILVYEGRKPIA